MKNAVGREIPEEILKITGKEVFHGVHYYDGYEYRKDGPKTRCVVNSDGSKLVKTIHEALVKCEIRDGMTIGFHHHFRDGDLVVNMVMEEIHKMGIKNITICASSLGKAHAGLVPYMEDGTITGIQSSGVRGEIGCALTVAEFGQSKQEKYTWILHLSEHRRVMIMETVVVSVERQIAEYCPMRW